MNLVLLLILPSSLYFFYIWGERALTLSLVLPSHLVCSVSAASSRVHSSGRNEFRPHPSVRNPAALGTKVSNCTLRRLLGEGWNNIYIYFFSNRKRLSELTGHHSGHCAVLRWLVVGCVSVISFLGGCLSVVSHCQNLSTLSPRWFDVAPLPEIRLIGGNCSTALDLLFE